MPKGWKPVVSLARNTETGGAALMFRSGPSRRVIKCSTMRLAMLWHAKLVLKGWETTTPVPEAPSEAEILGARIADATLTLHAVRNPNLWSFVDGKPRFIGQFSAPSGVAA